MDNGSVDDTVEICKKLLKKNKIVLNGSNHGYGETANLFRAKIKSSHFILANSDLYFDDENIRKLDEFIEYLMSNPSIAIAGMRQKFFDGKYQQAARLYFSIFDVFQPRSKPTYVFLDKFSQNSRGTQN